MEDRYVSARPSIDWIRVIARVLVACWAGLWSLFLLINLVVGLVPGSRVPLRWEGVAFIALALAVVVTPTLLAWRREAAGGAVLVMVGVATAAYGILRPPGRLSGGGLLEALLMQALFPIVAGVLFLVWRPKAGPLRS